MSYTGHTLTSIVLFTISDWIKKLLDCNLIYNNNNYKMIDVSQWRASIGLWNYCQAASSRPANGRHSHSFKAAVGSKSGSTTSGEKTSKLPAALSLIVSLLLSLLRYMKLNFIPPTGKQTNSIIILSYSVFTIGIITGTVMNCLQSLVLFIATIGSSSDLIYYLVLLLLLLLSGDVELNPGPITGKHTLNTTLIN